MQINKYWSR